ncbi:hypothetical protein [Streptomyces nodosus]|uniref:hypothetical protein n=1 Tax=Streptomyces nodosus TaxID=40318 RepID=UPI003805FF13
MSRPFRHPLASHAAGAILGYRRDGRPIYAMAGGSGDGGNAPAAPAPAAPAAPAAPTAPAAPAPVPQPTTPPAPAAPAVPQAPATPPAAPPQDVAGLPEWAQSLIRDTRAEAAQWRTRAQGTAPQPAAPAAPPAAPATGEPTAPAAPAGPDPARQLAIQTAVIAAAPTAGADIGRLLDSQAAMTALSAVDPTDANAVKQAITTVLATHRHLAAGPARGGAEFGAPQGDRTPATLHDAIAARMGG